jgi:hypothetical protein
MSKFDEFDSEYFRFQTWVEDFEKNCPEVAEFILREMGIYSGKRKWSWKPGTIILEYKNSYVYVPTHLLEIQPYMQKGETVEGNLRSFLSDHPRHPSNI